MVRKESGYLKSDNFITICDHMFLTMCEITSFKHTKKHSIRIHRHCIIQNKMTQNLHEKKCYNVITLTMAYLIHSHICHSQEAKVKRLT